MKDTHAGREVRQGGAQRLIGVAGGDGAAWSAGCPAARVTLAEGNMLEDASSDLAMCACAATNQRDTV